MDVGVDSFVIVRVIVVSSCVSFMITRMVGVLVLEADENEVQLAELERDTDTCGCDAGAAECEWPACVY